MDQSSLYTAFALPLYYLVVTQCLPASVPFLLDFNIPTPSLPECSSAVNLGSGNEWETATILGNGFDSTVLAYFRNFQNAANAWFFTQGIHLTAGTNYDITYSYGGVSSVYVENLKIMYGTSAAFDGMTEEIADHAFSSSMAITNTVTFSPPSTGVYYFGFNVYSAANQRNVFVDNISIDVSLQTPKTAVAALTYYPNPVRDVLHLSYGTPISNVTVFNLLGQIVLQNSPNQPTTQVDISGLPTDNYLVKVTADHVHSTSR